MAAEVRALAERSQSVATEIIDHAALAVILAEKAGDMLANLVPGIQKTARLVQEITASNTEQNSDLEQIEQAIGHLDDVTQQNTATSEELSAAAEKLTGQTRMLQEAISSFRNGEGYPEQPPSS